MSIDQTSDPPVVFISYSHDSDPHKDWVRDLATALRDRYGVDVILDQWEIGPGDDVPKFMERSVKKALRVLMVCTEPYVRKADDGKGGAGYEAMVVTGELVADLGTRKFVPIMRQSGGSPTLPVCVSTRFYVDFSDDGSFEGKLEELARSIHQSPKFEKPPLGVNPFGNPTTLPAPTEVQQVTVSPLGEIGTYHRSKVLADSGDFAKWRELVHQAKTSSAAALSEWRTSNQTHKTLTALELQEYFIPAVSTHANLFAAAFGGFDSRDQRFHNQLGLIDTIREPKGWARDGLTVYAELPDLNLFTYQALLGALAISRCNFDSALKLAMTPLEDRYSRRDASPLFKSKWAMGWPTSLNNHCTIAWAFLMRVAKEWTWLHELFGGEDDAKAAITAYYAFLNTVDCVSSIKAPMKEDGGDLTITVPLCFVMSDGEITKKAKSLYFSDPEFFAQLFSDNAIPNVEVATYWSNWMVACRSWVAEVYRNRVWDADDVRILHSELPRGLIPASGRKLIE